MDPAVSNKGVCMGLGNFRSSLIRAGRPGLTAFGVGVVVLVTCGGIGSIVWDLTLAPERRTATKIESDIHTFRLCPSISGGLSVHDTQEHARMWEDIEHRHIRVDRTTEPCLGHPPPGVAWIRHCNVDDRCADSETAGYFDHYGVDAVGRVTKGIIGLRGSKKREDWHIWHEMGHALGWAIVPHPGSDDGHDEHEGRVMSASAGWRWKGLP
jgi:hypothetical protein